MGRLKGHMLEGLCSRYDELCLRADALCLVLGKVQWAIDSKYWSRVSLGLGGLELRNGECMEAILGC